MKKEKEKPQELTFEDVTQRLFAVYTQLYLQARRDGLEPLAVVSKRVDLTHDVFVELGVDGTMRKLLRGKDGIGKTKVGQIAVDAQRKAAELFLAEQQQGTKSI